MNQPSATTRYFRRAGRSASRAGRGYTLIELLVVITIIVLLAGVGMPSIIGLFSAGAESTAYNLLAAQITATRACAIQNGTFAALHIQMSLPENQMSPEEKASINPGCYVAVMLYDRVTGTFGLAPGYTPRRMPGSMALGEISGDFVVLPGGTGYQNLANAINPNLTNGTDLVDFRTMTIVFSPTGSIVNSIGGGGVAFDTANDPLFEGYTGTGNPLTLWTDPGPESGVSAVVLFDNTVLEKAADRPYILNATGRLAPINVYTGQLFDR